MPINPPPRFVPADFDASVAAQVNTQFERLAKRPLESKTDLQTWMNDLSELASLVDEYGSRRYIDKSCHTDDADIEAKFMQFVENIEPAFKTAMFEAKKTFVQASARLGSLGKKYEVLERNWKADVEIFRAENVEIETQITREVNEYDKKCGAMMIDFQGGTYTPPQMAKFLEEPSRDTREQAWRAIVQRRLQDRESFDSIFDSLMKQRQRVAANAGMDDYRAYTFKNLHRFDYAPADCNRFASAVESEVMPFVKRLQARRREQLGVKTLRPWDTEVDPLNHPPLRPFDAKNIPDFVERTRSVFERVSPKLANDFASLRSAGNLDLESRAGKQPGGYQSSLNYVCEPFIFMNAAGLHRDVETLLHEGGHAFHLLACRDEQVMFLREPPMEFCEVASMGMELLAIEHLDLFYKPDDLARAQRRQVEDSVALLAWIATIDQFQHWLYTHPEHTQSERTGAWLAVHQRFSGDIDWTGLDAEREALWQRQLHLFHAPFYYIEYGIAQIGALQLWMKAQQDPQAALANYQAALALGGTRPLPELFRTAGLAFEFSSKTIGPLVKAAERSLETAGV